jgi:hypothetical protein
MLRTRVDVERMLAYAADEVMVVGLAGPLEATGVAWELDGCQPTPIRKQLQGAVDGGESDSRDGGLRRLQHFGRAEWAIGRFEDRPNRSSLSRVVRHAKEGVAAAGGVNPPANNG